MAVINNLRAQFTTFTVNNVSSRLVNCSGDYNTPELLNGGELVENELNYKFSLEGLLGHTIKSIVVKALLLNSDGSLATTRNIRMIIEDYGNPYQGNFVVNGENLTINSIEFNFQELQEENLKEISVKVSMPSGNSCYFAIHSLQVNLQDIDYSVNISFAGPRQNRTLSSITVAALLINQGSESVTFSKDPITPFDPNRDSVEGRLYLRKDGIYVDGTKYGTVAPATDTQLGLVKLYDNFETDEEGNIIPPDTSNAAATPRLVYNAIGSILAGITAPDVFIEEQVIPEEEGAEPTIQDRQITDKFIFSDEFESTGEDNRIRIKWLEIM